MCRHAGHRLDHRAPHPAVDDAHRLVQMQLDVNWALTPSVLSSVYVRPIAMSNGARGMSSSCTDLCLHGWPTPRRRGLDHGPAVFPEPVSTGNFSGPAGVKPTELRVRRHVVIAGYPSLERKLCEMAKFNRLGGWSVQ